ncbi:MAG TPA: type II secretion system protein [Patescibacteria group bacterium]|nr:type II secretion system protein [Patescibacteria group bacterium]
MKKTKENPIRQREFGFTHISKACERGFTLIELLVVISIIGILATLLIANIGGIRERARDARRKSDLNQIQKALEMYKNSQKPPEYPTGTGYISFLEGALETDYMQDVPHDPKCSYNETLGDWECTGDWPDYSYALDAADSLKYTLIVCLENASDQQKDGTKNTYCSGDPAPPASITRGEP